MDPQIPLEQGIREWYSGYWGPSQIAFCVVGLIFVSGFVIDLINCYIRYIVRKEVSCSLAKKS